MTRCPECSSALKQSDISCPSCGASLTIAQPTVKQPSPAASGSRRKSSSSTTTTSSGQGSFISGTVLDGRYRIVALLGRGGMGEVYKAEDLKLDHEVALKFLPESVVQDEAALTRFRTEVRIARQVTHQNVCRVFDIGEFEGRPFLTMEYIDGEDLSSLLRRIGRLPADKALEVSRQICAGLAAAHGAGVLHRDLKPANVMIDGRGKARLTDFGIAGLEEDLKKGGVIAGTPAYMSPEQITGKEITVQSDIYSLGLVLYELFTGKPAVQSDSISELVRKHKTITPTNPSEILKEIDPLVEKTILRCLAKDPKQRPASALQVAAMLPGGDPLAAALAAGETPSPEMVAAAPKQGALKPAVAIACLAAVVALFAFIVFFSGKVSLNEWVPLDKPPAVLAERARQIITKLGYTDAPRDTAYEFSWDSSYLNYAKQQGASPDRFDKIRTGQPVVLYFWYRTSPRYLLANVREVAFADPPNDVSGMTSVALDVRGRLIEFQAVTPQVEKNTPSALPTDWSVPFGEAGLDIRNFNETESQWTPPFYADERKAWQGKHVDHPEIFVRIEAAAFQGKPVYFNVISPWDKPSRQTDSSPSPGATGVIFAVLFFSLLLAALIIARYNLKVGRGDTKGAFKLAVFVFLAITLARLIDSFHVPELSGELWIFYQSVSLSLFIATVTWIFYIALEPFLRRRWSELLISWSRLMAGDFGDPLVGRDILVGGLMGLGSVSVKYLTVLVPQRSGMAVAPNMGGGSEPLSGIDGIAVHFLHIFAERIYFAIMISFLLLLLLTVLRKKWLAIGAMWLLLVFIDIDFGGGHHWTFWLDLFLTATFITVAAARFGLLALYTLFLVNALCSGFPITSDLSSWYAGSTLFLIVVIMGLAIYGFYTSLAGKRLLKGKLLEG